MVSCSAQPTRRRLCSAVRTLKWGAIGKSTACRSYNCETGLFRTAHDIRRLQRTISLREPRARRLESEKRFSCVASDFDASSSKKSLLLSHAFRYILLVASILLAGQSYALQFICIRGLPHDTQSTAVSDLDWNICSLRCGKASC